MNHLFYNIAGGIVHQIRREKRTTISEVIVRVKRNIMQNRNWFYFQFSVESRWVLYLIILKRTNLRLPLKVETDQFVICLVLPVSFCQNLLHFTLGQLSKSWGRSCRVSGNSGISTRRAWILRSKLFEWKFRCFSLFLPHLRTLAQEKRWEIVFLLRLVGRVSVSIHYCREI